MLGDVQVTLGRIGVEPVHAAVERAGNQAAVFQRIETEEFTTLNIGYGAAEVHVLPVPMHE